MEQLWNKCSQNFPLFFFAQYCDLETGCSALLALRGVRSAINRLLQGTHGAHARE
jgi:hypothetical protein